MNQQFGICCTAVEQHQEFAKDPLHQVGLVLFEPLGYNLLGGGNIPFQTNSGRLDTMTIADNLLWDVGKHSLKFGVEYRRWDNFRSRIFVNDMGRMSFDGRYTARFPNDPVNRRVTGHSIADNLLGLTWRTTNLLPSGEDLNVPYWDFYVQDDWRITPRLTLNLGLRYELFMQPRINLGSGLQQAKPNWIYDNLSEDTPTIDVRFDEWLFPQSSSDCACKIDKNDWAPRIGIAYRITDNTVIRSGAGLYYSENGNAGFESSRYTSGGPVVFNDQDNANFLADGFEQPVTTVSAGFPLYEINLNVDPTEYRFLFVNVQRGASNIVAFKKTINVYQ